MTDFPSDLADFAVAHLRNLGSSYADARLESSEFESFILKNKVPEVAGLEVATGLGARFIVNGCLGFVSCNVLEKDRLKKLLTQQFRSFKEVSVLAKEKIKFSDEQVQRAKYGVSQKKSLDSISTEEKLRSLMDLDRELLKLNIPLPSRFFSLSAGWARKYFVNSDGSRIESFMPSINCYYFLTLKIGKESLQRYWQHGNTGGWEVFESWNLARDVPLAVEALADNIRHGIKAPRGKLDIVTGSEVTGIIAHESAGHPYEADRILGREAAQAGESFVTKDYAGTMLGKDVINVVDDPTIQGSCGYYLYDDEGVKARRKFLLQNGAVKEFLHNRETAAQLGVKSNGSSRANSYSREAMIRMSNTFFLPGDHDFDEIVKDVKHGVYLKNFTEWNIDDKRVNQKYVGCEAYMIENGVITKPVKAPVLEIDTFKLFSSIDAVSRDKIEYHAASCGKGEPMQGIPVFMGGPSLRIREVRMR